jgi:hypothetical protein
MVDFPWEKYACLQAQLQDNRNITNRTWGLEAGLDRILTGVPADWSPANDNDVQRAISSTERRERHRAALRRVYIRNEDGTPHPDPFFQARAELRFAKAYVTKSDWALLSAVAAGFSYTEISATNGNKPGALRVSVLRLRRQIRRYLAAPRPTRTPAS